MYIQSMCEYLRHIGLTVIEPIAEENVDAGFMKKCVSSKLMQLAINLPQFLKDAGRAKAEKLENFQVSGIHMTASIICVPPTLYIYCLLYTSPSPRD